MGKTSIEWATDARKEMNIMADDKGTSRPSRPIQEFELNKEYRAMVWEMMCPRCREALHEVKEGSAIKATCRHCHTLYVRLAAS